MNRFLAPWVLTLLMAPLCQAQTVVGCADATGISFQSSPCPEGATSMLTKILVSSAAAKAQTDVPMATSKDKESTAAIAEPKSSRARLAIHTSRDSLEPGITDLIVLNNRRWGRPQIITRNRVAGAWHEYWAYKTGANGGKQLHFVNGVLADIENLQPAAQTAQQTALPTSGPAVVTAMMAEGR